MSRRSHSVSPSPRLPKRARTDRRVMTSDDFKDGIFLAPMVRSGALPTRLMALKHGATLVWGPEIVDKAILHAERVVDPVTGVVSYNGKSCAMFTTHPIEKPYLIYQIGSADPALAVEAALKVLPDVSGIDLNCGCPKSFSTHSGMGAALLTNPDLLCSILTALREALPKEVSVSAKIRLLPGQEDTLKLVERIVKCGVSAITVHCRTRNMRPKEKALVERLSPIVQFVENMGIGVAVVENGDCGNLEEARRIRDLTGAHSVMIATAAEANPTIFSPEPLVDLERTFIPSYLRLAHYLGSIFGLTRVCASQFKAPRKDVAGFDSKAFRKALGQAKSWDGWEELVGGWEEDEKEMDEIKKVIEEREEVSASTPCPSTPRASSPMKGVEEEEGDENEEENSQWSQFPEIEPEFTTPMNSQGPLTTPWAPLGPSDYNWRHMVPAGVSMRSEVTPSPESVVRDALEPMLGRRARRVDLK